MILKEKDETIIINHQGYVIILEKIGKVQIPEEFKNDYYNMLVDHLDKEFKDMKMSWNIKHYQDFSESYRNNIVKLRDEVFIDVQDELMMKFDNYCKQVYEEQVSKGNQL